MIKYLLVGSGGFIGAALRYWLSGVAHSISKIVSFPVGTLAVNLLGCLAIGFLMYLFEDRKLLVEETRLLVVVGVLGGFTTFSSFGYETLNLLRDHEFNFALLNIVGNGVGGLAAAWLGNVCAHMLWR